MFFTLQKIVWFLALPPASLLILVVAGILIGRKRRRIGRGLICCAILLLYVLSLGPVANALLKPLEGPFPPRRQLPKSADAVVVPGAGSVDLGWMKADPVPNAESWARLAQGVALARQLNAPLILTGGNGEPFATTLSDADVLAEAAYRMEMPRQQVIVENRSRNTLENARELRRIVRGDRIVLATSAYYMRRATAMFARRGFVVIPAPTAYLADGRPFRPASLIPRAGALASSSTAMAEWMSLAWWRLRGEI